MGLALLGLNRNNNNDEPRLKIGFIRPLSFSRHDQHNLEFNVALTCPSSREALKVDLFLFLPHSVHLGAWSREELRQDFHTRLRLAVQQNVSSQESSLLVLAQRVRHLLQQFNQCENAAILDEIFQKSREFGAVLGEVLKHESRRLRSELLLVASRSNLAPHPEKILIGVKDSLAVLDRLVQEADSLSAQQGAPDLPVIRLLRQYVHNLYMDFLVKLSHEQNGMAGHLEEQIRITWHSLESVISDLRVKEARRFQEFARQQGAELDWNEEIGLLRLSQIKKFFQSQMFIEVARKETVRRFSEPAAAGAAAFAAMWAGAFEYFSQGHMHQVGVRGAVVICLGVAVYVLKDRLKDQFRALFTRKLQSLLPESEQVLHAEGRRIGRVREWFSRRRINELPALIQQQRRVGDLTEAERHLPEDVLHYGQEFVLEPSSSNYGEFERSIQQVVRINIERFLKRLDDPYKNFGFFDGEGALKTVRSRRLYHFHALVEVRRQSSRQFWNFLRASPSSEVLSSGLFRVVVDKNGVERVVSLS